jgi:hypothetical protein
LANRVFQTSQSFSLSALRLLCRLFLAWELAVVSGCAWFEKPLPLSLHETARFPPIQLPPDAVQFDIVFVERPVGDALLGTDLWQHVDQVGSLDRQTRNTMRQSGFRAGVVASRPPLALQQMLGLKSDFAYEPEAERVKQLVGHHLMIRAGGETAIQVSPFYEECTFDSMRSGKPQSMTVRNARCLFKLKAERLQDGWAQLEFVPQVQYGDEKLRPVADGDGWKYQNSQRNEILYPQRFSLTLSVGEMVIVTADDGADPTLGRLFFSGPPGIDYTTSSGDPAESPVKSWTPDAPTVQRLLVIRLAGMGDAEGAPAQD